MKKRYMFLFAVFAFGTVLGGFYIKSEKVVAPVPSAPSFAKNDFLVVDTPSINAVIKSPITVSGSAKGTWYFEATFPVKVLDSDGEIIGRGIAHANGDWMTENFVPFSAVVSFEAKAGSKGEVVFEKDNPSGLPENAAELRVPIIFGEATAEIPSIDVFAYFGNTVRGSNEDCSKVFPVTRQISKTSAVARGALIELLSGTTETETKAGFFTSINPGVKIQKLTIENGVAKVDFSGDLEKAVGGSCRVTNIRSQIEATLKQFPTIKSVVISVDGRIEDILQP
jgi:hypothetical protein